MPGPTDANHMAPGVGQAISNLNVGNAVSVKVADLALDAARAEGEAAIRMLESAGDPAPRGAVSATPGQGESGGSLDVTA